MWEAAPYSTPPTADENGKTESEAITVSSNFLKLVKGNEREKKAAFNFNRQAYMDRESGV